MQAANSGLWCLVLRAGSPLNWKRATAEHGGPQSVAVVATVVSISLLHHMLPPSSVHWHNVFQYLYLLPIAWAALSFGGAGAWQPPCSPGSRIYRTHYVLEGSAGLGDRSATDVPLFCVAGYSPG